MFTEEQLEDMTMSLLDKLNYECKNGYDIERDYHSVFYDDTLFDDIVEVNLKKIQANEEQNEILSQLRTMLLPKLMNGEIELDNIEI